MKEKKLNILLSCLGFSNLTGSEMYVFELAKNLVKLGHNVSVLSANNEGPLREIAEKYKIKSYNITNPPGYVLCSAWGDVSYKGKMFKCEPNTYIKVSDVNFDIIHTQHNPITNLVLKLYPKIPKITTIHSEVISLENPVINNDIKKFIAIRPEIKDYLINTFKIPSENIDIIYNPIDGDKFNTEGTTQEDFVLFVGTLDYLRKNTLLDLIKYTKDNSLRLVVVGADNGGYANELLTYDNVTYHPATYDIEEFVKKCKMTAGILLGRTTIEGWMCGKSGWIYDIDSRGTILSKSFHNPPEDIDKFNSKEITKKINEEYLKILES